MLDADVAGCVDTFVSRGKLNLYQTAVLGLCYRDLTFVMPDLNEEGKAYYGRLERLGRGGPKSYRHEMTTRYFQIERKQAARRSAPWAANSFKGDEVRQ